MTEQLDRIEAAIAGFRQGQVDLGHALRMLADVNETLAEQVQAMAEQLDALTEAMTAEDDQQLTTLDGESFGGERDTLDTL